MKELRQDSGSVEKFDNDWNVRREALYSHYTESLPENQIQLAFQQHYKLFSQLDKKYSRSLGDKVLEVGCGRGTLSHFYAKDNYKCTLLDSSSKAVKLASESFKRFGLSGNFVEGDALSLPFASKDFDIVFSIGLLEHFKDIHQPLKEQMRILRPGGVMHVYVVPESNPKVDEEFRWINEIIKCYSIENKMKKTQKSEVFRTSYKIQDYVEIIKLLGGEQIFSSGVYPLPMISHSPNFPFSLMPPEAEKILTQKFISILRSRESNDGKNPWLCDEDYGQAFLVSCVKKK